jgi:hypothetical protein
LLAVIVAGCGGGKSSLPPTFPVTGTVKFTNGQPVAGGAVQFASVSDSSFAVSGDIGTDGAFTLATVKGTDRVSGAPEGEYKVSVQPPIPADHRAVPAVVLPKTYRVEPQTNTFTIEIAPPAPSAGLPPR